MTEETIILRVRVPAPTPAQVHAWLLTHGWTEAPSIDGWRDYTQECEGGTATVGIPQRYGKGGFSGVMSNEMEAIACHHGIEPIELYRQITEASHD